MVSVPRLSLLRQLASLRTISAVAEAEGLTRPAVSQQLAQLEQETGIALLERAGRSVRLTGAGRALLEESRALFAAMESVEAHLNLQRHEVSGEVRISAFSSVAMTLLPEAITTLERAYPSLTVKLSEQEPTEALLALTANRADVAIVDDLNVEEYNSDLFEHQHLLTDELFAVLPETHSLASLSSVDLTTLAGERWAVIASATSFQNYIAAACRAAGFEPRIGAECQHGSTVLKMVHRVGAVAVLPGLSLQGTHEGVAIRPLTTALTRNVHIAVRRGRSDRPAVRAVADALRLSLHPLKQLG